MAATQTIPQKSSFTRKKHILLGGMPLMDSPIPCKGGNTVAMPRSIHGSLRMNCESNCPRLMRKSASYDGSINGPWEIVGQYQITTIKEQENTDHIVTMIMKFLETKRQLCNFPISGNARCTCFL